MPAADCERLVDGFLAQPANAVSSLAFVVVGVVVLMVVRHRFEAQAVLGWLFGGAFVFVGVGSVAFHGPGGPLAGWAHDASITAFLVLIVAVELGYRAHWSPRQVVTGWMVAAAALMVVEGVWPMVGDPLNAPLAVVATLGVIAPQSSLLGALDRPQRSAWRKGTLMGVGLLGLGAIIMVLSRTGGVLCAPDALVQGHAIWHVLAAAGVGMYAISVSGRVLPHPDTSVS